MFFFLQIINQTNILYIFVVHAFILSRLSYMEMQNCSINNVAYQLSRMITVIMKCSQLFMGDLAIFGTVFKRLGHVGVFVWCIY